MATGLVLSMNRPNEVDGPWILAVEEPYDICVDKVYPLTQPSASIEHRTNMTFTLEGGNRVLIPPGFVSLVIENVDTEWLST